MVRDKFVSLHERHYLELGRLAVFFFFLLAMDGVEVCDFNYKILTMAQLEAGIGIRG